MSVGGWWGLLPGLKMAAFLLCPSVLEPATSMQLVADGWGMLGQQQRKAGRTDGHSYCYTCSGPILTYREGHWLTSEQVLVRVNSLCLPLPMLPEFGVS